MTTKKQQVAREVAKAVGAGRPAALETVDFGDPARPKTCLEVDFPILPVNQVAAIEGNAGKPIYQMSKWWARRRSSVFRSMLIAAATKAPDDSSHAAKLVWDAYYANHLKKGAFKDLRVADIFMGGGTTLVEGSRLGMQMTGNDLNPVAWFVVKQALAQIDRDDVQRLLSDIEAEVRPQIIPFYFCDGPSGEKGVWTHVSTQRVMPSDFDPLDIARDQRSQYRYEGPEVLHTFYAKHGECHVTGCGHRTPLMTSPLVAVKSVTVRAWSRSCENCGKAYDVEETSARISPGSPLFVAPTEAPYCVLGPRNAVLCPHCGGAAVGVFGKPKNKKVDLSLFIHPEWLAGARGIDPQGRRYGGSPQDNSVSTHGWNLERTHGAWLLEVRGEPPEVVTCPQTKATFNTGKRGGTARPGVFVCGACGTSQDVVTAVRAAGRAAPFAAYAFQGYAPGSNETSAYNGKFYSPVTPLLARQLNAAAKEWEELRDSELAEFWPRSAIPASLRATVKDVITGGHGYSHWADMFNARQLLVHARLLRAIMTVGSHELQVREYVLGAFQQYLRAQCMFSFWHVTKDHYAPALSNSDFRPKMTVVEVGVFSPLGYGNWASVTKPILEGRDWASSPWELVPAAVLEKSAPLTAAQVSGKSEKVYPGDAVRGGEIHQGSSTDLGFIRDQSIDLVITDPPFGDLVQYSELADFFYVWLRLALREFYPNVFSGEFSPKTLEAVANRFREPDDPDAFYQRLLTQCWKEANRVLKPGGMLAFTFHHSEDEPWVAVLESLFDAGFYLEATYPIRSDETKGDNAEFGAQKIEYDIIHVCRKRTEEPSPVSWGRMRREVMADVRQLQAMLENHAKEGLPAADIQVIRRGKALEYFSRHYGKVFVDEGRIISVKDALVGINQLIDEDAEKGKEPPPVNAEPMTRQFLRTFGTAGEIKRDQLQKFLRGTITTPDDFVQRGWCSEKNKIFVRVAPLEFARDWSGKHRRRLTSDLDQALVLVGACVDGSGINAADTLKNDNFRPHVALKPLLEWLQRNGPDQTTRNAASRAVAIYNAWHASQAVKPTQGSLFEEYDE